jgi:DNA-3-methyladenine glycosylase II
MNDGLRFLCRRDRDLAKVFERLGPPPLWAREPGFPTIVRIILEQQVSLSSAKAAFDRLVEATSPLTPRRFLKLDDIQLKAIGFSRQKTGYCRLLSESIIARRISLAAFDGMDDDLVRVEMMKLKGIGRWSADIYLLMALLRPDIWPSGDLALATAVQQVKRLSKRPNDEELAAMSARWRPWRAVAARLFWHHYLSP